MRSQKSNYMSDKTNSKSLWKRISKLPPHPRKGALPIDELNPLPLNHFLDKVYHYDPIYLTKRSSSSSLVQIQNLHQIPNEHSVQHGKTQLNSLTHSNQSIFEEGRTMIKANQLNSEVAKLGQDINHFVTDSKFQRYLFSREKETLNKRVSELSKIVGKLVKKNRHLEFKLQLCERQISDLKTKEKMRSFLGDYQPSQQTSYIGKKIISANSATTKSRFRRNSQTVQKNYQTRAPGNKKKFLNLHVKYDSPI